jgi:tetratricopeptide (TPR) repeat protein
MLSIALLCFTCVAGQVPRAEGEANLQHYMMRLSDLGTKEGPIPLESVGNLFSRKICESQNLAEQGKYAEAAKVLSGLLEEPLASDWRGMLQTRVAILTSWAKGEPINLKDYSRFYLETGPPWFHQRIRPIVTLWYLQDVPGLEKLFLLSSLLEKKGDREGQALALEAVPDLPGVDVAVAAEALVRSAGARQIDNDLVGAEKNWSRVAKEFPKTPAWSMAILSLGGLHKKNQDYAKAIGEFDTLLKIGVPEQTSQFHGPSTYYACVEIAACYEALRNYGQALRYAEMARDQYPFRSYCGTCLEGERRRLAQKISELKLLKDGRLAHILDALQELKGRIWPLSLGTVASLFLATAVGIAWRLRRTK